MPPESEVWWDVWEGGTVRYVYSTETTTASVPVPLMEPGYEYPKPGQPWQEGDQYWDTSGGRWSRVGGPRDKLPLGYTFRRKQPMVEAEHFL